MKSWQKIILSINCLLCMGASVIYYLLDDPNLMGDISAPVHVNIEIDKVYIENISIVASLYSGDILFYNLTGEYRNELQTAILYQEIRSSGKTLAHNAENDIIYSIFLRMPKESAYETLNAIYGISIFIGNNMFYFSSSDVMQIQSMEQDGYLLYEIPGLVYKKSMIISSLLRLPPFINWYGDLNLFINIIMAVLIYPNRFIMTWIFFICLFILLRHEIGKIYLYIRNAKKPIPEFLFLGFIIFVGFALRFNGYDRYSLWVDEIYSATIGSNPTAPFYRPFRDPGNPPFYYILLRLWFMLFGWTEQSGRLLSVFLGTIAIITLYFLVKRFTNKKCAFVAALYMTLSSYFIGYSQEMRNYILVALLVSIAAQRFLIIIQERDLRLKSLILYIIPASLLVNTHYYGSLFVFVTFLFYVFNSITNNIFNWKKTILFFTGNILIAISFLPYFILTALQGALLNSDFNTWIPKPGLMFITLAVLTPVLGLIYIYLRRKYFKKTLSDTESCFLDYSVFVVSVMYLIVFLVSMYRSILYNRHLIILHPFLIAILAVIVLKVIKIDLKTKNIKIISGLCICFLYIWISGGYKAPRGGESDVYREAITYISEDVKANPQSISMIIEGRPHSKFYGYEELPVYNTGDNYDVIYLRPGHSTEGEMYEKLIQYGLNLDRVLRIRVNNSKSVFKIYSEDYNQHTPP